MGIPNVIIMLCVMGISQGYILCVMGISQGYMLCVRGIPQGLCVKRGEWPLRYYQPFIPHHCVEAIGSLQAILWHVK